jgi:hypothetical protein
LFDKLRAGDTLVVRWVNRLGRNYEDVCDAIRHFMRRGVVIRTVINNFTFDGSTKNPMEQAVRDALIAFMAAMAKPKPKPAKPPRGQESSMPGRRMVLRILGVSRATPAGNSIRRVPC